MSKRHDLVESKVTEFVCSPNVKYILRVVYCDGAEYFDLRKWCRYAGIGEIKPTRQGIFIRKDFFECVLLPEMNKFFGKVYPSKVNNPIP